MAIDVTFIILYVKLPPVSSFAFPFRLLLPSLLYLQYKTGQISVDENTVLRKGREYLTYYPNWALFTNYWPSILQWWCIKNCWKMQI